MAKLQRLGNKSAADCDAAIRRELAVARIHARKATLHEIKGSPYMGTFYGYFGSTIGMLEFGNGEHAVFTRGWHVHHGGIWFIETVEALPYEEFEMLQQRMPGEVRHPSYECGPFTCAGRHYQHHSYEVTSLRGLIALSAAFKRSFGGSRQRLHVSNICKHNLYSIVPASIRRLRTAA